jgi:hypothetical protein
MPELQLIDVGQSFLANFGATLLNGLVSFP